MKHVENRIVIKVDMEVKNSFKFEDGTVLRLERGWNNLNQRSTQPINAEVLSAEGIPSGATILCNHNAFHPSYQIFNHGQLSGGVIAGKINYYSIPEEQAYLWLDGETWKPLKGYATALRVFKPYRGILQGIEPAKIKETLLITSGQLFGQIVHTLKAVDYEIIFQDLNGRENRVIRIRHSDTEEIEREEVIAISNTLTEQYKNGDIWAGLTPTDAKPINELVHA